MATDSWLWVALVAFLVFCCLPMLFMGRHKDRSEHTHTKDNADNIPPDGRETRQR